MSSHAIKRIAFACLAALLAGQALAASDFYYRQTNGAATGGAPAPSAGTNAPTGPQATFATTTPAAFTQQVAGGSACTDIGLSNPSSVPAQGLSGTLTKGTDFALCPPTTKPCADTLAAGGACNFGVRMLSTTPGAKSDTLVISGNAPSASVSLSGTYSNPTSFSFAQPAYSYTYGMQSSIVPMVSGGIGTKSFAFTGTPPAGLTLNGANGTVTVAAPSSPVPTTTVGIKLTDANGTTTANFDYSVIAPPTASYANKAFTLGVAVSMAPSLTSMPAGTKYALKGTTQLTFFGLTLDRDTGQITGTPNRLLSERRIDITATPPFGTAIDTGFRYTIQPPFGSVAYSSGTLPYGSPSSNEEGLGIGTDGKGYTIPAGGTITVLYSGTQNASSVLLAAGPDASLQAKIEYRTTSGTWTDTWWKGTHTLTPGSLSGNSLGNYPNSTNFTGIRLTNLASSPGQLDWFGVE